VAVVLDLPPVTPDGGLTGPFYNSQPAASGSPGDAKGGGLAMIDSTASLRNVVALNNSLEGGGGVSPLGGAYGGTFYAENSTLNLSNADIRGGVIQAGVIGGKGHQLAGPAGGGGIPAPGSSVRLNQVQVINNRVANLGTFVGGGGVWITRTGSSATLSAQIANTVVANNVVGSLYNNDTPPFSLTVAGGILLQGVDATLSHVT